MRTKHPPSVSRMILEETPRAPDFFYQGCRKRRMSNDITLAESKQGDPVMSLMSAEQMDLRGAVGIFWRDVKYALRSLAGAKVLTLALGIGANAAISTLVRGVLLRPLVNRVENRLIYIRQSAPGLGTDNAVFSVPEMQDLRQRVKSVSAIGDFSTIATSQWTRRWSAPRRWKMSAQKC